ncbi:MAG: O-antigen ligase family protein [Syntrophaceae bacterium]|nr:O-antigen ligase family protein [Syntrophaceae bacterium]
MNRIARYLDYAIEANIALVLFTFPFALHFFNDAWMALLILYAAIKLLRRERIVLPPTAPFMIIFVILTVFSVVISHVGFGKIRYLTMGVGTCLFAYDWFSFDKKRLSRVAFYFITSAMLASCIALYDELFLSLPANYRAQGPFGNTFYLALWSGIGIFIGMIVLTKNREHAMFIYLLGAIVVMICAFILSKTRAPWIAMILVMGLTFYFSPNKRTVLILSGVLAVLFASIATFDESVRARLLAVVHNENDLRWPMWQKTVEGMLEKFGLCDWLFGRGPRTYSIELPFHGQSMKFVFPHFLPMELLYSLGILGTVAFLTWIGILFYRTVRLLRESVSWSTLRPIGMTAFLVFFICFFNESFFARYFSFPFWFFLGISLALVHERERTG